MLLGCTFELMLLCTPQLVQKGHAASSKTALPQFRGEYGSACLALVLRFGLVKGVFANKWGPKDSPKGWGLTICCPSTWYPEKDVCINISQLKTPFCKLEPHIPLDNLPEPPPVPPASEGPSVIFGPASPKPSAKVVLTPRPETPPPPTSMPNHPAFVQTQG